MDIERLINFLIKLWDLQASQDHAGTATRRPKVTENHFKIMWSWWSELSLSSPDPECQCQCPNCLQMGILWTLCSLVGPFRVKVHSGPPRTAHVMQVNLAHRAVFPWVNCSLFCLQCVQSSLVSWLWLQCSLFSFLWERSVLYLAHCECSVHYIVHYRAHYVHYLAQYVHYLAQYVQYLAHCVHYLAKFECSVHYLAHCVHYLAQCECSVHYTVSRSPHNACVPSRDSPRPAPDVT